MTEYYSLAARIDGLEVRIAHQDRTIEELNAVITAQWGRIDDLSSRVAALAEHLREVEANGAAPAAPEPPPPHY